jgi:hypothetical protein
LATEHYDKPEPVNLGSGMEISIRDLAAKIATLTGFAGRIIWDAAQPNGQPRRCLDVSRAEREFGFRATTPFDVGLQRTIEWLGISGVLDAYRGELAEFGVEGQDLTVSPSAGGVGQRGIDKAQPGSVLPGKAIQRFEEKIRAGREFQFFGFQKNPAGAVGGCQIEAQHDYRHHLQEYLFEQQPLAPLAGQEALHENAGRSMVRVTWVVKPDQETGVEEDHRRSPYRISSISMLSCSLPGG